MQSSPRLDGRMILGVVALVCVLTLVWVVSALAGGSTGEQPAATTPAATSVQAGSTADDGRDCPGRGDGAEGDSGSDGLTSSAAV